MDTYKVLIATFPFGTTGRKPLELLEDTGWELIPNPKNRRLKSGEVTEYLRDVDAVIAGTEPYTAETLKYANKLKLISRVGIGLDSVDLEYCKNNGIRVTYTPEAPSQGVAELTVSLLISLLRHVHASDTSVREGAWNRHMGRLVSEATIGILGFGRIGNLVTQLLQPFNTTILANDIDPGVHGRDVPGVEWVDLETLLLQSDVLSLHIPMNSQNYHFIGREQIALMKTGAFVINTARGGVLDEEALTDALLQGHLGGAALDVFEQEPYSGPLTKMDNVLLTAHIGASARQTRYLMELGAAENCISVLSGRTPDHDAIVDMKI